MMTRTFICSDCGEEGGAGVSGPLPERCLECKRSHNNARKRWGRERNPEAAREWDRRWRSANPEAERKKSRRWRSANPEAARARFRRWQAADPEANRERSRRWARENSEKAREKDRRYRARLRDATIVAFTVEQLQARWDFYGGRCWMCSDVAVEWDHVKPLAEGGAHVLSNLRPACRSCNSSKGARWPLGAVTVA